MALFHQDHQGYPRPSRFPRSSSSTSLECST